MSEQSRARTLREELSFTESKKKIGSDKEIDDALEGILNGISQRPEGFDLIPGWNPLRLAKTDIVHRETGDTPALRLWFFIKDENTVSLLYVEKISDEEC